MTALVPDSAWASLALPDGTAELRRFPMREAPADAGWLRVTASGICGTDVRLCADGLPEPTVLGHHVVGELATAGPLAQRRWGLVPGDHVVVEEYLPCGHCETCASGWYRLCPATDLWSGGRRIGTVPASVEPGLSGGNAEYLYLPANAVVHKLPPELPWSLAAWTLPLANALDWLLEAAALVAGERVVVLGPGYHGLAAAAAAKQAGAAAVVVCGRPSDGKRLELAANLGCETVVLSGGAGPVSAIRAALGGHSADVVLDAGASDPDTIRWSLTLLGFRGRLVLTSPKEPATAAVDTGLLTRRMLTFRAVRGRSPRWITRAIELLASGKSGLDHVPTAEIGLAEVGDMLARLAAGTGPSTPHVVVCPGTVRA
ncbi:zinc-binding dehydrogenase [Amycolatopsis acidiphila]|uniref:Zinc-binding dehydrogenase n=1 Tax=Amycolatopsis acidiphila TaxID=715473 RepID=A0A558AL22_9PSEU|nr:zinc-binding dehydrogenase [Amycolatopsis acidiphila]TVT24967.1 zinc-binding dehydrogenase [Amycolatopsis acidiphila]UIJ57529.1 zinc-binding dehydrogenase [Amycolatopsis acidiphila]GHG89300.1 alcohol dehydrogenase [Amycolatopsis acidiphila]